MKKKYKNRKEFIRLANEMGLPDTTILAGMINPVTKQGFLTLVNNQRRFVKGSLKLTQEQQRRNMELLKNRIAQAQQEQAAKAATGVLNDSNGT